MAMRPHKKVRCDRQSYDDVSRKRTQSNSLNAALLTEIGLSVGPHLTYELDAAPLPVSNRGERESSLISTGYSNGLEPFLHYRYHNFLFKTA